MTPQEFDRKRAEDGAKILQVLAEIMAKAPQLRVGQIIDNACAYYEYSNLVLFYLENSKFLECLEKFRDKL